MGANLQSLFNGILNIFQPAVDVYNQQQQQSLMEQLLSQHPSLMTLNNPQALQQMTSSQTISADANGIGTLFKSGIGNRIRKRDKNSASVEEGKKGGKLKKIRKGLNSLDTSYLFNWDSLAQPSYADYLLGAGQNLFQIPNQLIGILNLVGVLGMDMSGLSDLIQMNLLQIQNSAEAQKLTQISTLQNKVSKLQDKKNGNPVSNIFGANDLKLAKKTKELADLGEGNVAQAAKGLKNAKMATSGSVMSAASGIANGVMDAFTPDKYYGASSTLKGLQQGYDAALDAIGMIPGVGTMVQGIGKLVETALMAANRISGKKADSFTVDDLAYENVGGSYSGSYAKAEDAAEKAGTLYGGFAKGAYKKAQEEIAEAKRQQSIVEDVSNTATERFNIADSMAAINNNRRELQMEGGYHQNAVSVGEEGEKLQKRLKRVKNIKKKKKKKMQEGGVIFTDIGIPKQQVDLSSLINAVTPVQVLTQPKEHRDRSMAELIDYAIRENPQFIERLHNQPQICLFNPDGEGELYGSHYLSSNYYEDENGNQYEMVFPQITYKKNFGDPLVYIEDPKEAQDLAIKRGDYLLMSLPEAELFTSHYKDYFPDYMRGFYQLVAADKLARKIKKQKEGSKIEPKRAVPNENDVVVPNLVDIHREMLNGNDEGENRIIIPVPSLDEIKQMEYQEETGIPEYLDGGSIIPEGALHAHKHNIDIGVDITKKGIPVVAENSTGEVEQVAEIERGEIILSKELTEKLENLCEIYYNKETEQEEKENAAFEAGKLLVDEIVNNTDDKTKELIV